MNMRDVEYYEEQYKAMITKMRGEWDVFMLPLVESAAQNRVMIDKIHEELTSDDATLTWMEAGSMAQNKTVVNPLLAQYDKCQKTQILFYKAMGLSYDATPSKIAGNRGGRDETDPMSEYFSAMQDSGKNI